MKPKRSHLLVRTILAACLLISASTSHADSARKLIARGNTAFKAGNWDAALKSYDEASIDAPESPQIYFNRGATFYRQEDYEKAQDAFKLAALKSVEPGLESRARYNLGNCAFREAERQRDSDPQKAFESCEESIKHFQEALEKDRGLKKAAENIEIVRIYMKALLDEINKQKEQEQQQQEEQEDLAKKLKELLERQQKELAGNQQLTVLIQQRKAGTNIVQRIQTLTTNQITLQTDTRALSDQVEHSMNPPAQAATNAPPAGIASTNQAAAAQAPQYTPEQLEKLGLVKTHVDNAVGQQRQAAQKLKQNQLPSSAPNQQTAIDELTKALEALKDENEQQQEQEQQDEQNEDDEEKEEEESEEQQPGKPEDPEEQESEKQEEEQKQAAKAEDILQDEKDNRDRRQPMQLRGFRAVDKNW